MTEKSSRNEFPTGIFRNEEFVITFANDGKHSVAGEGKIRVEGTYEISGDNIVLTDKSGEAACLEDGKTTGRYSWKFTDNQLIFSKIEDLCEGRIKSLTKEPMILLE